MNQVKITARKRTYEDKIDFDGLKSRIEFEQDDFISHERMIELGHKLVKTENCQIYYSEILEGFIPTEKIAEIAANKDEYKNSSPYNWKNEQMCAVIDEIKTLMAQAELPKLRETQQENGYKSGWVFYQIKDKYGFEIAQRVLPK